VCVCVCMCVRMYVYARVCEFSAVLLIHEITCSGVGVGDGGQHLMGLLDHPTVRSV
jgi:hypothetical protein